ncbi:Glycerate kinase [Actinosynnema pretiosum subsp. pretiosum]|nr:Glycerate kinase [Actinosynnema pretiosum subsp. pretiosum]
MQERLGRLPPRRAGRVLVPGELNTPGEKPDRDPNVVPQREPAHAPTTSPRWRAERASCRKALSEPNAPTPHPVNPHPPAPAAHLTTPAAPLPIGEVDPQRNHVVVALDSFKGSLTARAATAALARGLRRTGAHVVEHPVADGGEGTLDALLGAGFTEVPTPSTDALGRPLTTRYATRSSTAAIELAESSGLAGIADVPLTPARARAATTLGAGRLIAAALNAGHRRIVVGLGGSATTDGGAGMLIALGARLLDRHGTPLDGTTSPLHEVHSLDLSTLHPALRDADVEVACDVDNPLLGPQGAAAIYGPQKGADPALVTELNTSLTRWADLLEQATTRSARDLPGAGAAGGTGFALLACGARMRSGITLVLDLTNLPTALQGARLVIAGEGRVDHQTLHGKAPAGVAAAARAAGAPVVAVTGSCTLTTTELTRAGFTTAFTLTDLEPDLTRCHTEAAPLLERLGEHIAKTFPL